MNCDTPRTCASPDGHLLIELVRASSSTEATTRNRCIPTLSMAGPGRLLVRVSNGVTVLAMTPQPTEHMPEEHPRR